VAKTEISEDDPLFLVMVAMGSMEAAVVEVPKVLGLQAEQFSETVGKLTDTVRELEEYTKGLAATSRNLDRKLKAKLPLASRNSGLLARELMGVALVSLLAGTLFGRDMVGVAVAEFCVRFPEVCQVQGKAP